MSTQHVKACRITVAGDAEDGLPDLRVDCPNRKENPTVETCLACTAVRTLDGHHGVAEVVLCVPHEARVDPSLLREDAPCRHASEKSPVENTLRVRAR